MSLVNDKYQKYIPQYDDIKQNQTRSAKMTEKRIEYLIEDSGSGKNKTYARSWISSINPTDFLDMTLGTENQNREVFDKKKGKYGQSVEKYDYIEGLKNSMQQTPYLSIDENGYVGPYNNVNTTFNLYNPDNTADLLREGNILYTRNNESISDLLNAQRREVPKSPAAENASGIIVNRETDSVKQNQQSTKTLSDRDVLSGKISRVESKMLAFFGRLFSGQLFYIQCSQRAPCAYSDGLV